MKKIVIFVIIVAVFAVAVFYVFFGQKEESNVNFSKIGTIAINDEGAWCLAYEESIIELDFTEASNCLKDSLVIDCASIELIRGEKAEIKGNESDGTVKVAEIKLGEEGMDKVQEVQLFYYNSENDKDEQGNIMCSRQGLVPITIILSKENIIENAIRLLIQGIIPDYAKEEGVTTEYPLDGFSFKKADLDNGTLVLTFEDLNSKTGGGSCRVGILWFQIEATALQFPQVEKVLFEPEYLFQP
jgi:hypothetical protein